MTPGVLGMTLYVEVDAGTVVSLLLEEAVTTPERARVAGLLSSTCQLTEVVADTNADAKPLDEGVAFKVREGVTLFGSVPPGKADRCTESTVAAVFVIQENKLYCINACPKHLPELLQGLVQSGLRFVRYTPTQKGDDLDVETDFFPPLNAQSIVIPATQGEA